MHNLSQLSYVRVLYKVSENFDAKETWNSYTSYLHLSYVRESLNFFFFFFISLPHLLTYCHFCSTKEELTILILKKKKKKGLDITSSLPQNIMKKIYSDSIIKQNILEFRATTKLYPVLLFSSLSSILSLSMLLYYCCALSWVVNGIRAMEGRCMSFISINYPEESIAVI